MPRIQPVLDADAPEETLRVFKAVTERFGVLPNFFRSLAVSPALSTSHLAMMETLDGTSLSNGLREQIAIGTAQFNGCAYCLPAHTMVGKSWGKLDDERLALARRFQSPDAKEQAALDVAREVLENRGEVTHATLTAAHEAGWGDDEIVTILGEVVINILRNYLNRLAGTELDPYFAPIDPAALDRDVPIPADS